jgi:hypothetical protein
VCIIPLIFNQILCLVAFPEKEVITFFDGSGYSEMNLSLDLERVVFPNLYMNAPLISNFIQFFMAGIYGACLAALSFTISLYIRKNFIFNIGIVTIATLAVSILAGAIQLPFLMIYLNLYAFNYDNNIFAFALFVLTITAINATLIIRYLRLKKDVINDE